MPVDDDDDVRKKISLKPRAMWMEGMIEASWQPNHPSHYSSALYQSCWHMIHKFRVASPMMSSGMSWKNYYYW